MLVGYLCRYPADSADDLDLRQHALLAAGVDPQHLHVDDHANRSLSPVLAKCRKTLKAGDTLVTTGLEQLGRDVRLTIRLIRELLQRGVRLRVLDGPGAGLNALQNCPEAWLIISLLDDVDRALRAKQSRQRGKSLLENGNRLGAPYKMNRAKLKKAMTAMRDRNCTVDELCRHLEISRPTLYRYLGPDGQLRYYGHRLLSQAEAG